LLILAAAASVIRSGRNGGDSPNPKQVASQERQRSEDRSNYRVTPDALGHVEDQRGPSQKYWFSE